MILQPNFLRWKVKFDFLAACTIIHSQKLILSLYALAANFCNSDEAASILSLARRDNLSLRHQPIAQLSTVMPISLGSKLPRLHPIYT